MTGSNGRPTEASGLVHLSDAELAGYLDHDLSADERRRVETHIDACVTCRREVVALLPITHPGESPQSAAVHGATRWWVLAAAVVVIAAVALPRLTRTAPVPDVPQRARPVMESSGPTHLSTVSPADDATVGGRIVFTWRSTNADVYRVKLLTKSADSVWTTETGDTSVALPDSIALEAGQFYFWRVDAIGIGIVASTGIHRLRIPRQ